MLRCRRRDCEAGRLRFLREATALNRPLGAGADTKTIEIKRRWEGIQTHARNYVRRTAAFALAAAYVFASAAPTQAKEGTWRDTFAGFGMVKATQVGNERLLAAFDENFLCGRLRQTR